MAHTPTGIPPSRKRGRGFGYSLRRRIVDPQNEEAMEIGEENTPEQPQAGVAAASSEETTLQESSDGSSSTVIFEENSYLKNFSASDKDINKTYNNSSKTPSRFRGRKNLKEGTSFLYRTPFIKSGKNDYSICSSKRIPRAYEETWKSEVKNIMHKYWKVSYLSSMFGFHYTKRNFKSSYLRTLKIKILDVFPSYKLTVTITPSSFIYQNLKRTDSLFIVVNSLFIPKENDGKEEEVLSTAYEAILIRSKTHQSTRLKDTDWFPLLLYRGNDRIHNAVVRWLQASFGCSVNQKGLPMSSLLWLSASWSHGFCQNEKHPNRKDRLVILQYEARPPNLKRIPLSGNNLNLKLSLESDAIIKLWQRIQGNDDHQDLTLEQVTRFHLAIESLIENITKIPKALLSLVEVQTACNTISRTGRIRLTCDKSFTSLFLHLIELFEMICHVKNIDNDGEDNDDGEENEQDDIS